MKAYVIKNKEGKYWCGNDIFSATMDIRKIYICEDFDFISKVIDKLLSESLLKDCKIVEITIAEGNLEQELAEKDKEIMDYKDGSIIIQHEQQHKVDAEFTYDQHKEIIRLEQQLAEKDKEIEELKTRISELQDKDWYEKCISQLEEQNDKLIKERDEMQKELETSVDYWKNKVFKKMKVKLTEVTKEKIQETRHQVCDEIREKAETFGTGVTGILGYMVMIPLLDQIEKGE